MSLVQILNGDLIAGKKVLLRLDLDIPLSEVRNQRSEVGKRMVVADDFRLKVALPTLNLCLENAQEVIIMGHIGRPEGVEVPELSVEPIYDWLFKNGFNSYMLSGKLKLLENLRFEKGESFDTAQDKDEVMRYAQELASLGNFYVNEAFAAYHKAASTTVLPKLLPHAVGLRFADEVRKLTEVRVNPKRPLVAIIGGAKVEDKLPAIEAMSKIADHVLVGGKVIEQLTKHEGDPYLEIIRSLSNMLLGRLNEDGTDIDEQTLIEWKPVIQSAGMIVWNGPVGKISNMGGTQGTYEIAKTILDSSGESIVGGGDTIGFLRNVGLLEKFIQKGFVSVGGGAMLEFLTKGTLPTIDVLS